MRRGRTALCLVCVVCEGRRGGEEKKTEVRKCVVSRLSPPPPPPPAPRTKTTASPVLFRLFCTLTLGDLTHATSCAQQDTRASQAAECRAARAGASLLSLHPPPCRLAPQQQQQGARSRRRGRLPRPRGRHRTRRRHLTGPLGPGRPGRGRRLGQGRPPRPGAAAGGPSPPAAGAGRAAPAAPEAGAARVAQDGGGGRAAPPLRGFCVLWVVGGEGRW